MRPSKIFEVFEQKQKKKTILYTKNLIKGIQVYGEKIIKKDNEEFREWDPSRSKLAAAILKGTTNIGIRKGDIILYLGASTGTTVSHISDMVGKDGFIFALDFAPTTTRQLLSVCEQRKNIAPILADASQPETYIDKICQVDIIYMDIAQRNQVEIFLNNIKLFLKKGGYALLSLKAKSVDVTKPSKQIFKQTLKELEKKVTVIDQRPLEPFEKDHYMFIIKK